MAVLTLAQIAAAQDCRTAEVDVPEWGGAVRIREFTFDAKTRILAQARGTDGTIDHGKLGLLLIVHGVAEPTITEADADMLRSKNGAVVERLVKAIGDLNSIGEGASGKTEAAFLPGDALERGDAGDVRPAGDVVDG